MKTKIEWADYTFNPWLGCSKISEACRHCYAEAWAKRSGLVQWGDSAERRRTSEANWREPVKWNDRAICLTCGYSEILGSDDCRKCGTEFGTKNRRRPRVFCASLADVFEDREELREWRYDLFCLIHDTPNLDWLLLTKRPENISRLWPYDWIAPDAEDWPNVWLGTTVENQEMADKRIPELLNVSAAVRFLSCEPLLGPVNFVRHCIEAKFAACDKVGTETLTRMVFNRELPTFPWIDWVIAGGESGGNARPSNPDWFRSLRDQCKGAGTAFHFKQWGEWTEEMFSDEHAAIPYKRRFTFEDESTVVRVGKKNAGRLLDGIEWNEFPTI